jgi:protein transport protein SEC23
VQTGPGQVVDRPLLTTMRSHVELAKDTAPFYKAACAFYKDIAKRAGENGHAIDLFLCALDQTGYAEMKPCVTGTGGVVVLGDEFKQTVFSLSFARLFRTFPEGHPDAGCLQMGFGASMEVLTSRDYKVAGALGPLVSLRKPAAWVSDSETGEGGTYSWSLGAVDPSTSVAVFFDIGAKDAATVQPGKRHYLQIITYYQHSNSRYRMRVTTSSGAWSPMPISKDSSGALTSLAASFDQETAAVVMGRLAVQRVEGGDANEILRWLDRCLIRLCSKFAEYRRGDPASFTLAENFRIFPQFMFHMRRSPFMQVFNSSPDEAAYNRTVLSREEVSSAILMMQPSLTCYSFSAPPQPVLLDAASVRPDVVLLMDTFFHVVVFHGETIAAWREARYQDLPEHAAFAALLKAPIDDAKLLMDHRFPMPRYIVCDQHKSQARFLMARVNPSITHNDVAKSGDVSAGVQPVITDDVSYSTFLEHLIKLATEPT